MIGEIKIVSWDRQREVQGFVPCDGRSLPVGQYAALYSLIGNRFGGDSHTFRVPDIPPPWPGVHLVIDATADEYPEFDD